MEKEEDFAEEEQYNQLVRERMFNKALIRIGGTVQTILTGSIVLILLLFKTRTDPFSLLDWLLTFFSLFWLREVFNMLLGIVQYLLNMRTSMFGGDEQRISNYFGLWDGTFSVTLGLIGALICSYVIFKIVPKNNRLTLIIAGIIGSGIGYIFWMKILGPIVLP